MQRRRVALHRSLGRVLTLRSSASQPNGLFPFPLIWSPRQSSSPAGETEPNGGPTAIRVSGSQFPATSTPTMLAPQTLQTLPRGAGAARTTSNCAMSVRETGAFCRPGRTQEKREGVTEGVSNPGPALFGPLRAGSLTPTCSVSFVRQVAARMCAQIVTGFVTRSAPRSWPGARRSTS